MINSIFKTKRISNLNSQLLSPTFSPRSNLMKYQTRFDFDISKETVQKYLRKETFDMIKAKYFSDEENISEEIIDAKK